MALGGGAMAEKPIYKRYCRVCWYGGRCWRFAWRGAFGNALNWGGIVGAGALGALLDAAGLKMTIAEGWQGIVLSGLLYTAVAFIAIFLLRLAIAPFQIHREGIWHGTRFIYREPELAFHAVMSSANNNKVFQFQFLDAPPFSIISYKIETDGVLEMASICVMGHPKQLPTFTTDRDLRYSQGGFTLNKHREMFVKFFVNASTLPYSVRIYITGWDEGDAVEPPAIPKSDPSPKAFWAMSSWGQST
jgi:hypothetical protein